MIIFPFMMILFIIIASFSHPLYHHHLVGTSFELFLTRRIPSNRMSTYTIWFSRCLLSPLGTVFTQDAWEKNKIREGNSLVSSGYSNRLTINFPQRFFVVFSHSQVYDTVSVLPPHSVNPSQVEKSERTTPSRNRWSYQTSWNKTIENYPVSPHQKLINLTLLKLPTRLIALWGGSRQIQFTCFSFLNQRWQNAFRSEGLQTSTKT